MARREPKKPKKPKPSASAGPRGSSAAAAPSPRTVTLYLDSTGAYRFTSRARPVAGADWKRHGELRLIGSAFESRVHPDDVAKLPRGVLAGDCSKQQYCLGGPRVLYVDRTRVCRTCGAEFVFSASEQKHWYETLQFWTDSEAVDCPACRRSTRARKAVQRRHERAVAAVTAAPTSAEAQLERARAVVALVDETGGGDVDAGIAATRRARRLAPEAVVEALYWEARLEALRGRDAREALGRFLAEAEGKRRSGLAVLVADARRRLEGGEGGR